MTTVFVRTGASLWATTGALNAFGTALWVDEVLVVGGARDSVVADPDFSG